MCTPWLAERFDGNYGMALAIVTGTVAVMIATLLALGREPRGTRMGTDPAQPCSTTTL